MDRMTQKEIKEKFERELREAEGLWFSLNKGTVSFSKDGDKVMVRFFMSLDEWKEMSNYFSRLEEGM